MRASKVTFHADVLVGPVRGRIYDAADGWSVEVTPFGVVVARGGAEFLVGGVGYSAELVSLKVVPSPPALTLVKPTSSRTSKPTRTKPKRTK